MDSCDEFLNKLFFRKSTTRTIEELTTTISEMEVRFKSDLSRLKKKYEANINELEMQLDVANKANANLNRENKALATRVQELSVALDDERRAREAAEANLQVSERKRITITAELEEVRSQLELSDRARKNAESELNDANTRISELTLMVNTLTNDKRRLEGDIGIMQGDLDEAVNARKVFRFPNEYTPRNSYSNYSITKS